MGLTKTANRVIWGWTAVVALLVVVEVAWPFACVYAIVFRVKQHRIPPIRGLFGGGFLEIWLFHWTRTALRRRRQACG
ncbi:hypothetical protein [Streptomyces sp. NPDC049915]|uniref:hypothetical protein n=1 Tax=Streptomyces sp. NPDC049915 TaxID=3155510 RepID=UPI003431C650